MGGISGRLCRFFWGVAVAGLNPLPGAEFLSNLHPSSVEISSICLRAVSSGRPTLFLVVFLVGGVVSDLFSVFPLMFFC